MKLPITIFFIAALSISNLSQVAPDRIMPPEFKSDGCSWFPDGNYRDCCVEHDKAYFFGGSLKERSIADKQLFRCVKEKKGKFRAGMMWIGVRVGAVHFLPTPFRWGFGNKWPRKEPKKDKSKE